MEKDKLEDLLKINTTENWEVLSKRIDRYEFWLKTWNITRTVAAILILPLLSLTLFLQLQKDDMNVVNQIEVTSAHGLITKITLPDNSEVWLNSGSTLVYPQRFSGEVRSVGLTGEAYFKVEADKHNCFEVLVQNNVKVRAFGTEFNIDAYKDDDKIETTLVSGNVEVTAGYLDSHILQKGQQATYNKENETMNISSVNLYVKTAWKEGKMIFRRASMDEVVKQLSRRYNVEIELKDSELYDYEYSATFTTESIREILELLEQTAPIECEILESKLTSNMSFTKKKVIIQKRK